jgi:hypothetical protein
MATKRLSLWSGDRSHGTHLALTLLTFNSCRISSTLPTLILTSCDSSRTVMRRLARISSPVFKTLSGLTEVLCRRAWGSFSTRSRPSQNDFAQLNTLGCHKHPSPNCSWSLVQIAEGMTPSFMRNLIIICWATLLGTACTAILIAPDGWGGEGPD